MYHIRGHLDVRMWQEKPGHSEWLDHWGFSSLTTGLKKKWKYNGKPTGKDWRVLKDIFSLLKCHQNSFHHIKGIICTSIKGPEIGYNG